MRAVQEGEPKLQPIKIDGKIIPGLFAFDKLTRNTSLERDILIFSLEQEAKAQRAKIDASIKD